MNIIRHLTIAAAYEERKCFDRSWCIVSNVFQCISFDIFKGINSWKRKFWLFKHLSRMHRQIYIYTYTNWDILSSQFRCFHWVHVILFEQITPLKMADDFLRNLTALGVWKWQIIPRGQSTIRCWYQHEPVISILLCVDLSRPQEMSLCTVSMFVL